MVTYDRLDCTKKALASYLETVTVPFTMMLVDNGSRDGTQDWLLGQHITQLGVDYRTLGENKYPGFATNVGWACAPPEATFLHRADNDWAYRPGWCDHLQEAFADPKVGQVGLRTQREEPVVYNVGGNNVIRRELWDAGLRYDERPWTELPAGHSEDTYLSPAVVSMGYIWTRVAKPCIYGVSVESKDDPYYQRSYADRRIYGFGRKR
jgi:glycosyltransferase involved in cell wall biosynthesis